MTAGDFAEILLDVATGALPFIGGAFVAGLIIFALWLGIKQAVVWIHVFVENRANERGAAAFDAEYPDYDERYMWALDHDFNDNECDMYARREAFSHPERGTAYLG